MFRYAKPARAAITMALAGTFLCLGAQLIALPAQAQGMPEISPSLKKMLGGLPIDEVRGEVQGMVGALKKTPCGGGLTGCYATASGPMQLYFFSSKQAQQTFLLVIDKKMAMPSLLKGDVQKLLGGTSLSAPIVSISTTDYALDTALMPPALQKVVRERYFNVSSLAFASGVQLAARADLGGAMKLAMQSLGADTSQLTMRAAVVMPIPTDLAGGAGAGAGLADAMSHGDTMKKAGADALSPEAFVEFQFPPNAMTKLNMPKLVLTDATFFINNALTFGYKGNAAFDGVENKKAILHFQTPLTPLGAMDLLDFQFLMATPQNFTLEDAAKMMVAMASPDARLARYGGGFIRDIEAIKKPLLLAAKPLSVFQVRNPVPHVAIVLCVGHFARVPAHVHRVDDRAQPPGGVEKLHIALAVERHQRDAVAGLHAQPLQHRGQPAHALAELGPGACGVRRRPARSRRVVRTRPCAAWR